MKVAINFGSGYLPGLDTIVAGAAIAAHELGWEAVGIRDGYDGLLRPEAYPDGGLVAIDARVAHALHGDGGSVLGTAARTDPFRVRTEVDGMIEELDCSDRVLSALAEARVDAVISVVGGSPVTGLHALSVAFRLARKGLRTVCVPKSAENDIAGVPLAFGFNSVLSHVTETLGRARAAALDAGRIAVVEVPGQHAGWLALQSGLAALADAVLIPEVPYELARVADALSAHEARGRKAALVVVAEGARTATPVEREQAPDALRASLAPNADPDFGVGGRVMNRQGAVAEAVAGELQRRTGRETLPLTLGHLVRGGAPTAVDRQLGLAYGAAAVRGLAQGQTTVLVSFQPPAIEYVPLADALSRVRTMPSDSELMILARALGIALGTGAAP
ncbi:MAG: 6-phosphofructokinase [Burkholderiales bacterium]